MAILMMLELPRVTTEDYDRVQEIMFAEDPKQPDGLISHVAGPTDDGVLIIDVWESEDDLNRFVRERVGPAMQQVGAPQAQPRVLPIHAHIPNGKGTDAGVILVIESDGFRPDDYDVVTAKMDAHAGDGSNHPAVSHAAAVTDGGMVFVDVWDSPESFGRFTEQQLGPAAAGADLPAMEPRFVPVHNRMVGKS
jgi:hypothetical protein